MQVLEYPFPNRVVKISLHELKDQVDILIVFSPEDMVQPHYIGVREHS